MRQWICVAMLGCLLAACAPAAVISESTVTPAGEVVGPADTPPPTTDGVSTTEPGPLDIEATPGQRGGKDVVVVFERGGGFAGVQEKWTIYADGAITLAEDGQVAAQETGRVTAEQVSDLLAGIDGLGFFEMQDSYTNDECADCFQYTVTVTSGGVTKTVNTIDAAKDAPPELGQVLTLIQTMLPATN